MRNNMVDTIQKKFEDTVQAALRTEKIHGFRLCIDEKYNTSIAKVEPLLPPICPSGTKKILDVLMTPSTTK
jgi:hypothetical protein